MHPSTKDSDPLRDPLRRDDVAARAGRGDHVIGYVDVHLLASASIDGVRVWPRDKALAAQAAILGLAFQT